MKNSMTLPDRFVGDVRVRREKNMFKAICLDIMWGCGAAACVVTVLFITAIFIKIIIDEFK